MEKGDTLAFKVEDSRTVTMTANGKLLCHKSRNSLISFPQRPTRKRAHGPQNRNSGVSWAVRYGSAFQKKATRG